MQLLGAPAPLLSLPHPEEGPTQESSGTPSALAHRLLERLRPLPPSALACTLTLTLTLTRPSKQTCRRLLLNGLKAFPRSNHK